MFEFTSAAVTYCVVVSLAVLILWLLYDRRDRARYDLERRKTTFHCIRCGRLFTAPQGTELAKCPKCGHENARLRF
jgi:hypothetical protein